MARHLIGFKEMKNKHGKVLYFVESNPWTTGYCINEDKRYSQGYVYGEEADLITKADLGKEFKFHSKYEAV